MKFKNEILDLLHQLKMMGYERSFIEQELGYSSNYIDQTVSKGGNKLFLTRLKQFFDTRPENAIKIANNSGLPQLPTAADRSIRRPKTESSPYLVPFVDIPAQAGYTKAYSDIDYIQTLKMYPILPDVDPHGAVWRYFQVDGDSMEDVIRKGDILLTSQVNVMDWPDIKDYYTYVIVTDTELLIKDILRDDEENIILLSQNDHYKPRRMKMEDIRQIWVMRRHIMNRLNNKRRYDPDLIKKELKKL